MSNPAIRTLPSDSGNGGSGGSGEPGGGPESIDDAGKAERVFSRSIIISGIRCVLTYVIFPFVAPLLPLTDRVGPVAGLVIGTIALVANMFSIRRFHAADHKWKWQMTALNVAVMILLVILLYLDIGDLLD